MSIKDLDADLSEVKCSTHQPEMPLQGYAQKSQSWYKRWLSNNKEFTTPRLSYWPLLFCLLIIAEIANTYEGETPGTIARRFSLIRYV
jgi:hypothetical protein